MRFIRTISIFVLAILVMLPLLGCKQRPIAETPQTPIFDPKTAVWARIDVLDVNSPVRGFVDTKTYLPVTDMTVDFWHKLSSEKESLITHMLLDCQQKKYKIMAQLTYDSAGTLLSQETKPSDWQNIAPNSNTELLCTTLAPTGEALIYKEDLPIIRDLMRSGIKKVK